MLINIDIFVLTFTELQIYGYYSGAEIHRNDDFI